MMKKLLLLAAGLATLLAVTEPTFAASRAQRADRAQAAQPLDQVQRDYYSTYRQSGHNSFARGEAEAWQPGSGDRFYNRFNGTYQAAPGQNLPYPDRPYGAPNKD